MRAFQCQDLLTTIDSNAAQPAIAIMRHQHNQFEANDGGKCIPPSRPVTMPEGYHNELQQLKSAIKDLG